MKKISKPIALLLIMAMLTALFAGCGGSSEAGVGKSTGPPATSASENQSAATPAGEPAASAEDFTLPIVSAPAKLTLWTQINPMVLTYISGFNENTVVEKANALTNVTLDCTSVAGNLARDQFSIMVASGDYADFMYSVNGLYPNGIDAAVDDNVIIDLLKNGVEEKAPHFWKKISEKDEYIKIVTTDAGYMPCFGQITDPWYLGGGYAVRKDWLDKLSLSVPETYDDLYNVLTAFKSQLGITCGMQFPCYGIDSGDMLSDGMDFALAIGASNGGFYVVDGKVRSGYLEKDKLAKYISRYLKWYAEGLIDPAFASDDERAVSITRSNSANQFLTGNMGVVLTGTGELSSLAATAENPDMKLVAIKNPRSAKGQVTHVTYNGGNIVQRSWAVSTGCKDVDLAMKYMDFWYTDTGIMLASYGVEDQTYTMQDGRPVFTDLVLKNPDDIPVGAVSSMYLVDDWPSAQITARNDQMYSAEDLEARKVWYADKDLAYHYPTYATMTAGEGSIFADKWADIKTYLQETMPQFIMGALTVDKDLDGFIAQLKTMGIEECLAYKQAAYNRYMSR